MEDAASVEGCPNGLTESLDLNLSGQQGLDSRAPGLRARSDDILVKAENQVHLTRSVGQEVTDLKRAGLAGANELGRILRLEQEPLAIRNPPSTLRIVININSHCES